MTMRIAVLVILALTSAHARAGDDGAKTKKQSANASSDAKIRAPRYVIVTKAGRIAIHEATEAPADESAVESGDHEGEVSYVGKDGLVHRVYTVEHLQKLRETFGDHTADLIDEAHRVGGRTLVKDVLNLKAALETLGTDPATARGAALDYLDKPTGKRRDDALEDALIANGVIPPGLKGTGRSLGQLLDLAANSALLGGVGAGDITPGLVKGFDDVKHGRRTIDDLLNEYGNAGAGIGANDSDEKSDDAGSAGTGGFDSGSGSDDALGGGYQDESHDDTERGDDGSTQPAPGGNPSGDDTAGADDGDDAGSSGGATYTVDEVNHNDDGTTDVTFHVTGSDGQDGIYTTTYATDGTYTTTNAVTGEVVGSGTGTPPDVEPGDTTQTTQGDQAVFPSDEDGDDDGAGSDEDGGSDSGSSGGEGDGSGDGAQNGGAEGSVGYTPNPDGEGAPLPDDIDEFIDRTQGKGGSKGMGGGGDDDECDGDGKHIVRIPKDRPSPVEVAEIEKARKLKLIGNPKGVDAPRTGAPSGPPAQDGGDIDWGPDHVGNEGMGGGGVDPRGTKKIGADHRNDSAGVGGNSGGGSVGMPSNGNGGQSQSDSDANAGDSKKQAKRKVGSVTNKKIERARVDRGPKAKFGAGAVNVGNPPPVKPKSPRRPTIESSPPQKSPMRGIGTGKKPRVGRSKD